LLIAAPDKKNIDNRKMDRLEDRYKNGGIRVSGRCNMGIWFFSGFPLGCQPAPPTEERCVDRGIMVRIESKNRNEEKC
jgi:hypothetical protein